MSIVAMKKLRLIGVRSQKDELLRRLMLLGCVEISSPDMKNREELLGTLQTGDQEEVNSLRQEKSLLLNALKILDKYAPAKQGLLTAKPEVGLETLLDETARSQNYETSQRIIGLDRKLRDITARESRERTTMESLRPWSSLELPLDYPGTRYCAVSLGSIPGTVSFETAAAAVSAAEAEAELCLISGDSSGHWVVLVSSRDRTDNALAALKPLGFSAIRFAGLTGTAAENIRAAQQRLQELDTEKAAVMEALKAEGKERFALKLGSDTLSTCLARAEAAEKLLNTKSTFYFEGWQTAPDEKRLEEELKDFCCARETEEPDPEHPEEVPVKLHNNILTRPFNMVTEMYSLPAYNGLDPNPFIMPFFAIFFGIMFADMAYGLILIIAASLLLFKAKPKGGMKNLAGIMLICGVSTFIFGFLTGGFFGDAVSVLGRMFGREWAVVPNFGAVRFGDVVIDLPLNLLEGNNPLYVLIAAVALGAVHLAVGVGIGAYLKFREGEWIDAVFNDLSWWVILAGIGMLLLGKGNMLLFAGLGMMVLGSLLTNKGIGKITGIFSALYNGATGYLGDLLSYSRLMALMLAGSVIASVFNQLGALGGGTVGGVILFIAVFCIGHLLNFGLNVIGCFVHTLRLQYLEFFGKWYRDGGRPFKPLNVQTKYVDIKED